MEKIDYAIIGAGIVGLSIALKIQTETKATVVLFEKEKFFGDHTSGRNSGVLHSGIYYQQNSLKHRLCIDSLDLWKRLASDYQIEIRNCGKFIFAESGQEQDLEKIFQNGLRNDVADLRFATTTEKTELKTLTNCSEALWVGSTSIVDQPTVLKNLMSEFENRGGIYLKNHEVSSVERADNHCFHFSCKNGLRVESNHFINAAGLFAISLREKLGLAGIENHFVKGCYLKVKNNRIKCEKLLYPIPEKNLKGLGVHLTLNWDKSIKFGPNTEDVTEVEYSMNDENLFLMKQTVIKTFKNMSHKDLVADYCGIRPKIKINGELYTDFYIEEPIKGYIELLGIESPGFTSSLAIAERISKKVT